MNRILNYLLPVLLILTGCSSDATDMPDPTDPTSSLEGGMTFVVNLPDPNIGPTSYALVEKDENEVETVDVLAFYKDGSGKSYFVEHAKAESVLDDEKDIRKKSFRVNFEDLRENRVYCFVVLANVRDLLADKDLQGLEQDVLLQGLYLENISRWIDDGRHMPMWGESGQVKLKKNMTLTNLTLLRMLAKINVTVDEKAQQAFALKSVRLYNYRRSGLVVPLRENLAPGSTSLVERPSVLGDRLEGVDKALIYTDEDLTAQGCTNTIYTFETDIEGENASEPDFSKLHCLVIGGDYDGSGEETFYRVNFNRVENGVVSYLNLLRNHRYTVNIVALKGPGYTTPEQAFNSKGVNMEAQVQEWNDGELSEIIYDGQFRLSVTPGPWTFYKDSVSATATNNEVIIETDYPEGWKVVKITDTAGEEIDWLRLSLSEGIADKATSTRLLLGENTTGIERKGVIHIQAGSLRYQLSVRQLKVGYIPIESLSLSPQEKTLVVGETFKFELNVLPLEATNPKVFWGSSSEVVTISSDGTVVAVSPGKAVITVVAEGAKTAQASITVIEKENQPNEKP